MKEAAISYLSPVNLEGRTFAHQNKISRRSRRGIGFYKIAKESQASLPNFKEQKLPQLC